MYLSLHIKTDNAAFEDDNKALEVVRILKKVVTSIESGTAFGRMKDTNGNFVGDWTTDYNQSETEDIHGRPIE